MRDIREAQRRCLEAVNNRSSTRRLSRDIPEPLPANIGSVLLLAGGGWVGGGERRGGDGFFETLAANCRTQSRGSDCQSFALCALRVTSILAFSDCSFVRLFRKCNNFSFFSFSFFFIPLLDCTGVPAAPVGPRSCISFRKCGFAIEAVQQHFMLQIRFES
jgi:hypothetical protein